MSEQIKETEVTEREIPCLHVMHGHQAGVYGALLLRDGRVLSYAPDEPFILWNPLTGNCLDQIPACEPSIAGMLQIDDEQILLWPELPEAAIALVEGAPSSEPCKPRYPSPFEPSHIVLWNLRTHSRNPLQCECVSPLAHVELAEDGWLRAWSHDGVLFAWKMSDPDTVFRTDPLVPQLTELIVLSDGRSMLRTPAHELRIDAKDQEGFDLLLKGHKAGIRFACELSDGRILSCSEDATLRLFNSRTGLCEQVLKGHQDVVIAACELLDGQLLSWSADETFRVWNPASGRCVKVLHDKRAAQVWRSIRLLCWKVVLWSQTTESWLFNPATLEIEGVLAGHEATIRGFVQLKDGNVVSFSDDRTLRLWQTGAVESEKSKIKSEKPEPVFGDTASADESADMEGREPSDAELQMMLDEIGLGGDKAEISKAEDAVGGCSLPSGNGQLPQTSGSQTLPAISFSQRCKAFHRTKRTSGHPRPQQEKRRIPMSEENKDANEATQNAQQCFMDYLAEEGFRPNLDKDGDIHFKYEGNHYYLLYSARDRQFVRMIYPNFWPIESDEERQRALAAANMITGQCKCCKVYVSDEDVNAAVELFVAEPSHAVAVLGRALGALQHGVKTFAEEMRKEG
jgi:WD40 repeat protein